MLYAIRDKTTTHALAVCSGDTPQAALDAMAKDRNYPAFDAWAADVETTREQLDVTPLDDALQAHGRALYGPTYRGFRWYDQQRNAALLDAAGEPGRYEPHAEACSGYYATRDEAALAALRD